ncbi:PBECR4 domain-containing protein, partial [Streptobacillus moniliformis]|uniref:PBECR4 domain-containing protein n=1 Tax=Streptobacillus moniliformis TaxID=34105 RepID=UPI000ACE7A46
MKDKICTLINEYRKYFNIKLEIKLHNKKSIYFTFDYPTFCHLLGIQYATNNIKKYKELKDYLYTNKVDDNIIYKNILKNYGNNELNFVKRRIENIDYALKNLEKGIIVGAEKTNDTKIKSNDFILELKNNKFLELGLVNKYDEEYYLETFLVRNNDNNVNYSKKISIEGIYKVENEINLIPFSFDIKKNKILEAFPEYSYQKCIDIYEKIIENEKINEYYKTISKKNINKIMNIYFKKDGEYTILYLDTVDLKIELIGYIDKEAITELIDSYKLSDEPNFVEVMNIAEIISKNNEIVRCLVECSQDYLYDLGLAEVWKDSMRIESYNYEIFSENFDDENIVYTKNDFVLIRDNNYITYTKIDNEWKIDKFFNDKPELFDDLKKIGKKILEHLKSLENEVSSNWD